MMKNNFFTVGMFQLKLDLASNFIEEYLIENEEYHRQMKFVLERIASVPYDIILFPEMSYSKVYSKQISNLSLGKIIVFGSIYENGRNTTKVFQNGVCHSVVKRYPSGAEPMSRHYQGLEPDEFINHYLLEHTFSLRGMNVYVLNCLEYYHVAYYIARKTTLQDKPFIFCCPCSNSNTTIFRQESIAIHNHNENTYTFMCNTISQYNGKRYGDGQSYIYGPIQSHEKAWLTEEYGTRDDNINCIVSLSSTDSMYCEGKFLVGDNLSRFGRSDFYMTTPQNMNITNL